MKRPNSSNALSSKENCNEQAHLHSRSPSLLLLDEPTLGLSPKYVSEIFEVIDRLRQHSDLSVLVIEHNLNSLLHIADRGYVLARGKVVKELTHQDFSSRNEVYRAIVGE